MADYTPGIQYDANTGERLPADWRAPRYSTPDMTGMDMNAVNANIKAMGVEQALKAIEAAVQFQGLRGYQQALKNGESPEKAMVRYGPMIFNKQANALAPTMRAVTPPVAKPVSPLDQARIEEIRRKAALPVPARSASPGSAIYDATGKIITSVPSAASTREKFDTVVEKYDKQDAIPPTPAVPGGWFRKAVPATPGQPFVPEHEIRRQIPRGEGASNAAPSQAVSPAPTEPAKKILVVSPEGRRGFIPASQKDSALEQGYKLVP